MATAATNTPANRTAAIRYLSDEAVATRAAEIAFALEGLTDAGPYGLKAGSAIDILGIRRDMERLANETAAERPAVARTLRTAAGDLIRAGAASEPSAVYAALCDGLRLVEQQ